MVAAAPHPSIYVWFGIVALVVWRLYARIRRMVGRQKLKRVRPWITVVVFPILLMLLLLAALAHPLSLAALVAGAALGAGLGAYGLRVTKFEATAEGLFYTPSAHLGIALSLLFIVRIGFRLVQFQMAPESVQPGWGDIGRSPLTTIVFGTLAGYYVAYAIGLLRWRFRVEGQGVGAQSAPVDRS